MVFFFWKILEKLKNIFVFYLHLLCISIYDSQVTISFHLYMWLFDRDLRRYIISSTCFTLIGVFEMWLVISSYMFDSYLLYCTHARLYLIIVLVYHILAWVFPSQFCLYNVPYAIKLDKIGMHVKKSFGETVCLFVNGERMWKVHLAFANTNPSLKRT